MLKDDRMMGMLTFVVIMIAVGTMVQRLDFFQRLFGSDGPAPVLNADVAEVRATEPLRVDVLANDTGVEGAGELTIIARPRCGQASVRDGEIHYLGTMGCIGVQSVGYGVGGGEQVAELRITVTAPEGRTPPSTAEPPAAEEEAVAAAPAAEADGTGGQPEGRQAAAVVTDASGGPVEGAAEGAAEGTASEGTPLVPAAELATATPATGSDGAGEARGDANSGATSNATSSRTGQECTLPPTLTLDLGPGAVTGVAVDSPCHRGTVAELAYDGLRFAIPLDVRGQGRLEVPGFQRSTEATIAFEHGEPMTFGLPFEGVERVERVAIAWEAASGLALNAFEFGARPGSAGHVTPGEPRSFEAVRREGGGWLDSYRPEGGLGQRIDVYSFWRRHAGPAGVVRLALDPAGEAGTASGACRGAAGVAEGADYVVLRSAAGRLERSRLGRVAGLDCTVLAGDPDRYIDNAVDDLIVRRN